MIQGNFWMAQNEFIMSIKANRLIFHAEIIKWKCLHILLQTESGKAKPFPVMIYIHDGEFYRGASNLFPGHVLAAFYNVVVVTFNYRLGALGKFLTLNHFKFTRF